MRATRSSRCTWAASDPRCRRPAPCRSGRRRRRRTAATCCPSASSRMPFGIRPPRPHSTAVQHPGRVALVELGAVGAAGDEQLIEVRPDDAVGAGGGERVAGPAVGREHVLRLLVGGGDLDRAGLRVTLLAEGDERQHQDAERREDSEEDEWPLAHRVGKLPTHAEPAARRAPLCRYQGHIRRSSHSPHRGIGRQTRRPWVIRLMCSS